MSFNKVILIGNLTRDPEVRTTQSGASIGKFSLALNRRWQGRDGKPVDEACFIDVEAFGKSAETIARYFGKGDPILVEGHLKQETWEDRKGGGTRSKHVVSLERFEFVRPSKEGGAPAPYAPPAAGKPAAGDWDFDDDNPPF